MGLNANPNQLLQMIRQGINPQQLAMNILEERASSSPMYENFKNLVENNRGEEIEHIARNAFKSQGRDFDEEFNSFKRMLGIK